MYSSRPHISCLFLPADVSYACGCLWRTTRWKTNMQLLLRSSDREAPWMKHPVLDLIYHLKFYPVFPGGNVRKTISPFLTINLYVQARTFILSYLTYPFSAVVTVVFRVSQKAQTWLPKIWSRKLFISESLLAHVYVLEQETGMPQILNTQYEDLFLSFVRLVKEILYFIYCFLLSVVWQSQWSKWLPAPYWK